MIAADLIDEARDYHETFDNYRLPDGMLIRRLTGIQASLFQQLSLVAEETLGKTIEFTAEEFETDGATGLLLPAHHLVYRVCARFEWHSEELPIVSEVLADQYHRNPRQAYLRGNLIFPVGSFTDLVSLSVTYVPLPVALDTPRAELTLPDEAQGTMVSELALWMAGRRGVLKELPHLPAQVADERKAFLEMMSARSSTIDWRVRQVP